MKLKRTPNSSQNRISETFQNVNKNAPKPQAGSSTQRRQNAPPMRLKPANGSVRNQAIRPSKRKPMNSEANVGSPQDTSPAEASRKPSRKAVPSAR